MKLHTLFRHAVAIGIDADPRGKKAVEKLLRQEKEKAKKLEGIEKELFDEERTWNPYLDSRILNGTGEEDIHSLMVGIDIETPELLLANVLRASGKHIDAVMVHHPEGRALMDLDRVMPVQVDVLAALGVAVNQAEAELGPRMERIRRSVHADNLFRADMAAKILGLPLFGCHTITDNLVFQFMEKTICKRAFDSLKDILNAILHIQEYKEYARRGSPPIIVNGSEQGRPGRIAATEFTGGTNGPEQFLEQQARAGVGTILSMHVTEKSLEEAKKYHVNMIQCNHMASDSLGINLLLDHLRKEEKRLTTIEVSGFVRVARTK